jgi:hypothetical protein
MRSTTNSTADSEIALKVKASPFRAFEKPRAELSAPPAAKLPHVALSILNEGAPEVVFCCATEHQRDILFRLLVQLQGRL